METPRAIAGKRGTRAFRPAPIPFGYPAGADPVTGQRPRMPLDNCVRRERW